MTRERASRRRESRAPRKPPEASRPRIPAGDHRRLHWAVLAVGVIACGLASLFMGEDNNWDLLNYHCYNAYAFLHDRIAFDIAPAQRQSYLNPIVDVPFYLGSHHLEPRLFGFLLGGLQGLTVGLLFSTCFVVLRTLGARLRVILSLVCTGLGVYGPVFVGELGGSENDSLVGLLVLASVGMLVAALADKGTLDGRAPRKSLVVGALILGMGAGLKPTVMPHVLAIAAGIVVVESAWGRRIRVLATWSVIFLAGFLVTNGYWMARLWHEFRNPLFPFYNNIFHSPWAESRSFADASMLPATLKQVIAVPFILAFHNPFTLHQALYRDPRFAVLWLLLVVFAAQWGYRRLSRRGKAGPSSPPMPADQRFLLVFFVVSFVVWEATFNFLRYTVCLEALGPLLIVLVVWALWRSTAVRIAIITTTFALTAVVMHPIRGQRIPWGRTFWQVSVPEVADPHALIIIANSQPLSYMVPRFAPGIRWVSVMNNLTDPRRPTRMQEKIQEIIGAHRGEMYLLTRAEPDDWLRHDVKVLTAYHLELAGGEQPILTKHSPAGLRFLRLQRYTPPPPTPSK